MRVQNLQLQRILINDKNPIYEFLATIFFSSYSKPLSFSSLLLCLSSFLVICMSQRNQRLTVKIFQSTAVSDTVDQSPPFGESQALLIFLIFLLLLLINYLCIRLFFLLMEPQGSHHSLLSNFIQFQGFIYYSYVDDSEIFISRLDFILELKTGYSWLP